MELSWINEGWLLLLRVVGHVTIDDMFEVVRALQTMAKGNETLPCLICDTTELRGYPLKLEQYVPLYELARPLHIKTLIVFGLASSLQRYIVQVITQTLDLDVYICDTMEEARAIARMHCSDTNG